MEKNNSQNIEVKIEHGFLFITKNKKEFKFEVKKISKRLAKASQEQLQHYSLSPSNYGIHWALIDEDISIPALLNEPIEEYVRKVK